MLRHTPAIESEGKRAAWSRRGFDPDQPERERAMLRLMGGMTRGVCKREHVRSQNSFLHRPRIASVRALDVPGCAALRALGRTRREVERREPAAGFLVRWLSLR